jgi:hypothetical protein
MKNLSIVIGFFSKVCFVHNIFRYLLFKGSKKLKGIIGEPGYFQSWDVQHLKTRFFWVTQVRDDECQNQYSPGQTFNTINLALRELIFHQEIGNDRNSPAGQFPADLSKM